MATVYTSGFGGAVSDSEVRLIKDTSIVSPSEVPLLNNVPRVNGVYVNYPYDLDDVELAIFDYIIDGGNEYFIISFGGEYNPVPIQIQNNKITFSSLFYEPMNKLNTQFWDSDITLEPTFNPSDPYEWDLEDFNGAFSSKYATVLSTKRIFFKDYDLANSWFILPFISYKTDQSDEFLETVNNLYEERMNVTEGGMYIIEGVYYVTSNV